MTSAPPATPAKTMVERWRRGPVAGGLCLRRQLSAAPLVGRHLQVAGDYRESWQPQPMSDLALARSQQIALMVGASATPAPYSCIHIPRRSSFPHADRPSTTAATRGGWRVSVSPDGARRAAAFLRRG